MWKAGADSERDQGRGVEDIEGALARAHQMAGMRIRGWDGFSLAEGWSPGGAGWRGGGAWGGGRGDPLQAWRTEEGAWGCPELLE